MILAGVTRGKIREKAGFELTNLGIFSGRLGVFDRAL